MRGTDGIGATVAEPLIAAVDKEKHQIGNQSCVPRGFEIFWWTVDWDACLSVHLSVRRLGGFDSSSMMQVTSEISRSQANRRGRKSKDSQLILI